jgi:hypothetical protein
MFDWVPIRAWLLIAIAAAAYPPALTVYRFVKASSSYDDLFPRPESEHIPERGQFARSLFLLIALAGLAMFIFTSAAEKFSQSPTFWPVMMAAIALFSLYTTVMGAVRGTVEPLIRGSLGPYSRDHQPVRYWLSMIWNLGMVVAMTCAVFWVQET